jgi:hypothetical protein
MSNLVVTQDSPVSLSGRVSESPKVVGNIYPGATIQVKIIATGPRGEPGESVTTLPAENIIESENRVFLSQAEKNSALAGSSTFVFTQLTPASVWHIVHNLNRYPAVSIVDSAGSSVIGDVNYDDANTVTINFAAGFSGKAYLN